MSSTFIICPRPTEWQWLHESQDRTIQSGDINALATAFAAGPAADIVLVVPAEDLLLHRVDVPARSRKQLRQATPYALEDALAAPVETLHFAFDRRGGDAGTAVAVVDRQLLQSWLDALKAAGITPDRAVAETQLIPWQTGSDALSIVSDTGPAGNGRCLLRWADDQAGVTEAENLGSTLEMLLAAQPNIQRIYDYRMSADTDLEIPAAGLPVERHDNAQPILGNAGRHGLSLNLLQGRFAADAERSLSASWRWPAVLAAACLLLATTANLLQWNRLRAHSAALDQAIQTQFRQAFPEIRRIQDPLIQARQAVEQLRQQSAGANSEFLMLLAHIAPDMAARSQVRLRQLRFQDNRLRLDLAAPALPQLEQLQQTADADGIQAALQAAAISDQQVTATLELSRGTR